MIVGKGGGLVTVEKVKNEGKEMKLGKEREKIAYNRSGKGKKSQFCFFLGGGWMIAMHNICPCCI